LRVNDQQSAMCGLVGFWAVNQTFHQNFLAVVENMAAQVESRGPDSYGSWCDQAAGIAFGHRRLAVVDLSLAGHQPMASANGRMVLIYNGEIYNADEIRKTLIEKGCRFHGNSDTEVILEACCVFGVEQTCRQLIGMFAFAVWDKRERKLYLVRDRLGIKPLYWGFKQGVLFFGSQVKSFFVHPAWKSKIDLNVLASYFRYNYVPAPHSIFTDIQKLRPAHILTVDQSGQVNESCFWDFDEVVRTGKSSVDLQDESVLTDQLETLLKDAVNRRMVADVPLGAFLSGGIDSSMVVALMQAQSATPINTFSIGFHEAEYNEAPYAKTIAQHLGTTHHELYLGAKDAYTIIPGIPNWFDEPFADVSAIPTYLVSKMAREHVTVALSGDGGDELFGGYNRYLLGHHIWNKLSYIPSLMRRLLARGIQKVRPEHWDKMIQIMPDCLKMRQFGDRLHKLADILPISDARHFYQILISQWHHPNDLVMGGSEFCHSNWIKPLDMGVNHFIEKMQYLDTLTYLPDDILTKVDRTSMAVSLEARVPLLDHRIVEFSWRLPLQMKVRGNTGKWLLRQVLNRYIPNSLIERPKMGFGVPIDHWLRNSLREWAEDLLSEDRLRAEGILNVRLVRDRWTEHLSGRRNWQYALWGVLMFQSWKARWKL